MKKIMVLVLITLSAQFNAALAAHDPGQRVFGIITRNCKAGLCIIGCSFFDPANVESGCNYRYPIKLLAPASDMKYIESLINEDHPIYVGAIGSFHDITRTAFFVAQVGPL